MTLNKRDHSIDALRGLAILGMVFSGTIVHTNLIPGWMYHAQVGPPEFIFTPDVPGITWVDLVFPFFLFAMGLSFPLAMEGFTKDKAMKVMAIRKLALRAFQLFAFAVAIPHLSFFNMEGTGFWVKCLFPLTGFLALGMIFTRVHSLKTHQKKLTASGYLLLLTLLFIRVQVLELPFSIHRNDIIILVLANMAFFAGLIWLLTFANHWARITVLVLYLGLWLTKSLPGTLNQDLYEFTLLKWMGAHWEGLKLQLGSLGVDTDRTVFYSMYFLKYLFIVIPGSIIGDYLAQANKNAQCLLDPHRKKYWLRGIAALMLFAFIPLNLLTLYLREHTIALLGSLSLMLVFEAFLAHHKIKPGHAYRNWLNWCYVWLVLGLLLEPYEGGIKKDPATLSYFFVTSGLAGLLLLSLKISMRSRIFTRMIHFIPEIGKNPMVGYVAVSLFIMPLLSLFGMLQPLEMVAGMGAAGGLLRGVILTTFMVFTTMASVRLKLFWKT